MNNYFDNFEDDEITRQKKILKLLDEYDKTLDTPEKMFDSLVRAGIYTPDGELTEVYR